MLAPKGSTFNGRPTFANPMYHKKAQSKKPSLYEIPYDTSDLADIFALDKDETMTLEKEKLVDQAWVKHTHDSFCAPTAHDMEVLIKTCLMPLSLKTQNDSFKFVHELKQEMHADLKYIESLEKEIDELESNKADFSNMYDLLLQECVSKDVMCSYLHSLSDLDAHTELQCLYLNKVKECECKPTPFSNSLERKSFSKTKSVPKTNVSEGLSKLVTSQSLPQTARQAVKNTNVIKPGMYRIDTRTPQTRAPQLPQTSRNTNPHVSTSTGVIHKTSVSRSQLRSTQMKEKIVQLILFLVDSRCTKHMMGNLKLLYNFVKKYMGIICFGNDQFTLILGYGDLVYGNIMIIRVYYVEGLNHNLILVGQFCDADLEVAFQKSTCFVRDL
ncbi:hypothetical protein Tco_0394407 [Tanacetum coccineum]